MINTYGSHSASDDGASGPPPHQPGLSYPDMTSTMASGFIIDPDGLIVTNAHVIANADAISVRLQDGQTFAGTLIGMDEHTDLALLKITASQPLPAVSWGNSSSLQLGHRVVVLGNPFGLGLSATEGIIAGLGRDLLTSPYDRFIQIDASVVSGDSGGPLVDTAGRVVGVNTAMLSWCEGCTGIGFAVPADLAMIVTGQLLQHGRVPRGYVGIQTQPLTPALASLSGADVAASRLTGELLTRIDPGSPAEAAGLRLGDIVLAVNRTPISASQGLLDLISQLPEDSMAKLLLWRNGTRMELPIKIIGAPGEMAAPDTSGEAEFSLFDLDLAVVPIDNETRRELAVPADEEGWLLVWTGSADLPGSLVPGDVITHLDGLPLPDLAAFHTAAARLKSGQGVSVLARVWRNGSAVFVPVWNATVGQTERDGITRDE
ncbi:trypsin-like peptidase domain-containing protein [Leisingera sp.]|uniref:trypsin-like peptidase domain-containing protein n=1 Tax=Leisingera sp. TaxID=1879318 RepID=UPI002B27309A|nr:trypsin-like peptidase domain-containing protein [Leisingera sp.]